MSGTQADPGSRGDDSRTRSDDPLTGAREIAQGVFVFTSGAYALNSGAILGAARPGHGSVSPARPSNPPNAAPAGGAPRTALLVDPAYFPSEIERIAAFLAAREAPPGWIALTHSDWDHIVGPARWPGTPVVASSHYPPRTASDGERISRALASFDRKLYVERPGLFTLPQPDTLVGSPSDLVWDGPAVHLLPAGGHTADGLMLLLRTARVLFAGDHLSDREIPFVGDSLPAYLETLASVRRLVLAGAVEILVPGHGTVSGRAEILARIEEDADYLSRLDGWVRETRRSVATLEGILERCDEVVFRKGWDNPDVRAEHGANVSLLARTLGLA